MNELTPVRVEVIGVDHIYLTVADFPRAEKFYDTVLGLMDFRKGDRDIGGDPHRHYFNRVLQISIRPARATTTHDPYAPGLHHLCLQVATTADVDRLAALLRGAGIAVAGPTYFPEYAGDYYALFFADPDGLRHEIVARRSGRQQIVERWDRLTTFLNPLSRLRD